MECIAQPTEDAASRAIGECVTHSPPLDRADCDHQEGGVERCNTIPAGAVAGVGEADGGYDGPAEGAAGEYEEGVGAVARGPGVEDGRRG